MSHFSSPDYNITVQISTSQSHLAHRPATLVCHASLNTTLPAEQTLHITWNGDTHQITANTTRYKISETVHTCHNNSCGADNTHFKSELTVVAVKPAYNSTYYACSAAVVSSSDGQALSDLVSSSVVFSVIGEHCEWAAHYKACCSLGYITGSQAGSKGVHAPSWFLSGTYFQVFVVIF